MLTLKMKETIGLLLSTRLYLYSFFYDLFGTDPEETLLDYFSSGDLFQSFGLLSETDGDAMEQAAEYVLHWQDKVYDKELSARLQAEYQQLHFPEINENELAAGLDFLMYLSRLSLVSLRELPAAAPEAAAEDISENINTDAPRADGAPALLKDSLTSQKEFLQTQLLMQAARLLNRLKAFDASSCLLYPQMAMILMDFLKKDQLLIQELLDILA